MSNGVHGLSLETKRYGGYAMTCKVSGQRVICHLGVDPPDAADDGRGLRELCAEAKTGHSFHAIDEICGALHVVDDLDGRPYESGHLAQLRREEIIGTTGKRQVDTVLDCSVSGRSGWNRREGDLTAGGPTPEQVSRLDRVCRVRHLSGGIGPEIIKDYSRTPETASNADVEATG